MLSKVTPQKSSVVIEYDSIAAEKLGENCAGGVGGVGGAGEAGGGS